MLKLISTGSIDGCDDAGERAAPRGGARDAPRRSR